jgi:hypothetical protein
MFCPDLRRVGGFVGISSEGKRAGTDAAKENCTMLTIATFFIFASALLGGTWFAIKEEAEG